jgi:hypothetical protein
MVEIRLLLLAGIVLVTAVALGIAFLAQAAADAMRSARPAERVRVPGVTRRL